MSSRLTRVLGAVSALFLAISFSACATMGGGGPNPSDDLTVRVQCEDGMVLAEDGALYVQGVNQNWQSANVYLRAEGASRPVRVQSHVSTNSEFGPKKVRGVSPNGGVYLVIDPIGGDAVQHPFELNSNVGERATLLQITLGQDGVTPFAHSHVESYGINCLPEED